ncbi:MAG TPA: hypothetical protein IAC41_12545 [Candidatus Merdenecus merdavium]|nr:hypothetical protein [Candidatus Merdenecus merdavium]
MFEQDYIMRLIFELIRFFIKAIFNIDIKQKEVIDGEDLQMSDIGKEKLKYLQALIKKGNINQAEDLLYQEMEISSQEDLKVGLLFYESLNQLDPAFLEESGFTYEEIKDGVERLLTLYGYQTLLELFHS